VNNWFFKTFLFLAAGWFISQSGYGQAAPPAGPGKIKGKVVDVQTSTPLEFATISVYTTDSVLVTGGITSADGSFSIEVHPGNYYVSVQFISYNQKTFDNIRITPREREFDLGMLSLEPARENLEEVQVIAEKSEMVINLDKKVFNVGKDLSNTGQSALDILDNIPSVTVDLDGNVSLRGSENLQILIDGKPSGLVSGGNTQALRSLQGSMIERIEVITNPSARYEAEGMAGIINVVLRKDQQKGVNGSFEVTAGYPHNYAIGANVNFRREKINYFLNYSLRYGERPGGGYSWQRFNLTDTSDITIRDQDRTRTGLSNRIRAGADYFLSPTSTLTGAVLFSNDKQVNTANLTYEDYLHDMSNPLSLREIPAADQHAFTTLREDIESEDEIDLEFSLNYEKKFTGKDHKFNALVQYILDDETEESDISESVQNYLEPGALITNSPEQRVFNAEKESNLLIKADYTRPIGNKGMFEAGYRSALRNIYNPYYVIVQNETDQWDTLPEYSNNFEYIENIHGIYVQAGNNYGDFSVQLGLRGELSDVRTYLHETNEENERLYFDLFPSVHTSYQFNSIHSAQISYSRRIHRPRFWHLNPFFSYTDPRNYRAGNPNLEPEYINSFELGYLFKREKVDFYTGIYYRYTRNVEQRINEVTEYNGNTVTVVIPQNLDDSHSYGFEANASVNPVKWWTLSGDVNFYRYKMQGTYEDQYYSSDDFSWNTRFNSKFRLPAGTNMQFIFFYRAPKEGIQGTRENFYMLNAAISKDVLKGNGTLTFNVRDVLDSMRFRYTLGDDDDDELYSYNEWRHRSRIYTLTFVYRLNQKKRMGRNGNQRNGNGDSDFGGEDMEF